MRGIPAYIVMPSSAPAVKRAAVEGYAAEVIECEPTLEARERTTRDVQARTGAHLVHPYDDPHVIAGQATAALELIEERGPLDLMIAPVGGGGLMSGTCISTRALCPQALLWGAEPEGADDAARSLQAGELIPQTGPNTICDGLLTSLGQLTWPIIRDHVQQIVTVTDPEVIEAMRLIWTRLKIIIEPSCATPLAALLKSPPARPARVGVILSGGNVDLDRLPW
jgi:threonine dehydratase